MAKFDNKTFEFTGNFGQMSVYKMRGIERPIVRTKGGATRETISKSPKFELTRLNNEEFGNAACSAAAVRLALFNVRHLNDHNFTPKLNGLCRTIMTYDQSKPLGRREVNFSAHRHLLEGFSLNKVHIFDSVLRHPLYCAIDRNQCSASVTIPAISPGLNFSLPWMHPMYRIVVTLGVVHDGHGVASTRNNYGANIVYADPVATPWLIAGQPQSAATFVIRASKSEKLSAADTLIVSVGIEMGTLKNDGEVQVVKHAGCAKILTTG